MVKKDLSGKVTLEQEAEGGTRASHGLSWIMVLWAGQWHEEAQRRRTFYVGGTTRE